MNRVELNERRLDSINESISELNKALENFRDKTDDIKKLNKYYGSKEWFIDIEKHNKGKLGNTKAGVLSEDAVWNMNENISDLINDMEELINNDKSR